MKRIITTSLILVLIAAFFQGVAIGQTNEEFAMAKAGKFIAGAYIFLWTEPVADYDYVGTIKVKIDWEKDADKAFDKLIRKARKEFNNFDGVVFNRSDFTRADLIKFRDREISGGGFRIDDMVSTEIKGVLTYGKVTQIDQHKGKITIEYLDPYGLPDIAELKYDQATPADEVNYTKARATLLEGGQKFRFSSGQEITFSLPNVMGQSPVFRGKVLSRDDDKRKVTVQYMDEDKEKTATVGYDQVHVE